MPYTVWELVELFAQGTVLGLFVAMLVFFFVRGVQETWHDYREAHRRGEWDPWR